MFHLQPNEAAVQSLTVSFSNNVAVGLPLLISMFGPEGTVAVAAGIGVGAIVISPVTLVVLESGTEKAQSMPVRTRLLYAVLQSCKRPIVWAPLLGMAFSLIGIPIPDVAGRMLNLIGQCTAGVALFLTGLILSAQPFRLDGNAIMRRDPKEYCAGGADVWFRALASRPCAGSASRGAAWLLYPRASLALYSEPDLVWLPSRQVRR